MPMGAPDRTFGASGLKQFSPPSAGWAIAAQPDGRLILAGQWEYAPNAFAMLVVRLNDQGAPDPSFASSGYFTNRVGPSSMAYNVAALDDGRILLSGSGFTNQVVVAAIRLKADGRPDASFGSQGVAIMNDGSRGSQAMTLATGGRPVFGSVGATAARMTAAGRGDASFGSRGYVDVGPRRSSGNAFNGIAAGTNGDVYGVGATAVGGKSELLVAALHG